MKMALEEAGYNDNDTLYINAHGTGTALNDVSETAAFKLALGDNAYKAHISSTKGSTGHLLGAAGALEAVITVLAIENKTVPPTINFEEGDEDPEIDYKLNFTFNKAQERDIKVALSNTFGFGGHNTCIIFKKIED
jgi:3-oxoacyl-[acyl-carrier-protein] synthase II